MDIFVGIVVGLLVLMFLVTAHEFGHFIAARRNGVRVPEFGIGFPPRAIAWIKDPKTHKWRKLKKSEWDKAGIMKTVMSESEKPAKEQPKKAQKTTVTVKNKEKLVADGMVFSLNWLPIGGFCQMDGESAEDERPGTFGHASFWKKTKILFAGVAMNWLVAWIILTILAWTGMPQFLEGQFTLGVDARTEGGGVTVAYVIEDSPAEKAGFQEGDKILSAGDTKLTYPSDVNDYNDTHAGEEVVYTVERMRPSDCDCVQEPCECPEELGEVKLTAKLNDESVRPLLGVGMSSSQVMTYSTWSAPIVGAGITLQITGETFKGVGELLWNLVTGTGRLFSFDEATRESGQEALSYVGDSVSGPVGIIGVLFPSFTAAGPTNLAFLTALISISLACMNVLPIPALDGGRWLLIAIYKLRHKKLTKEKEQRIVSRAMMVLLVLLAVVTILDITRFFR